MTVLLPKTAAAALEFILRYFYLKISGGKMDSDQRRWTIGYAWAVGIKLYPQFMPSPKRHERLLET